MAQKISEVMTGNPTVLDANATVAEAARAMRDGGIGDVVVNEGGRVCGIVTDRDIVVRAVADERAPGDVRLRDVCSADLVTVQPDTAVDEAVRLMRDKALRRLPVVRGNDVVGIVSLGDLAIDRDPDSALGGISEARPNN
jgi:CBS domain-containing protein